MKWDGKEWGILNAHKTIPTNIHKNVNVIHLNVYLDFHLTIFTTFSVVRLDVAWLDGWRIGEQAWAELCQAQR